jgi:hypothetical protein
MGEIPELFEEFFKTAGEPLPVFKRVPENCSNGSRALTKP